MSNFIQITPFMHVEDLEKALAFFNDILGFETQLRMANYAYLIAKQLVFASRSKKALTPRHPATAALRTTSTFATSISSTRNSNRNWTLFPRAMFTVL